MDSLTHIALGACIGELYAGKSLGKKALLIGAVAQSLPDIDFIASFWNSPASDLLAHRGFTHSFLFIVITAYPLALIAARWQWLPRMSVRKWTGFLLLELFIHLFLDAFNAYGTAWFEPFSHYRVSFHTLFVADPFFSISIAVAAFLLIIFPTTHLGRRKWARNAIIISAIYLGYALFNKFLITSSVEDNLAHQQITYKRYFTTPTPGNVWLWNIVAEGDQGFYIGYRSVFDTNDFIPFQFFNKNDQLLDTVDDHEEVQHLKRFSEGYYVVSTYEDKLVFNDLRFGQMLGWENPTAPFVFYYYLDHPTDNELLIQRGRFARWNNESAISFLKRIGGQ
ncbi:MAG: metal-dependent hydrolase [Cyclobacteriaceae bacterium]